jgi:hypothetical protein
LFRIPGNVGLKGLQDDRVVELKRVVEFEVVGIADDARGTSTTMFKKSEDRNRFADHGDIPTGESTGDG